MSQAFYIPDSRSGVIRYVNTSGIISTPTLDGSADPEFNSPGRLVNPWGAAFNPSGTTLYIVDESPEVVYAINATTYVVTKVAGHGAFPGPLANSWVFNDIYGIACNSQGNIVVGDVGNAVVVGVNLQATTQTILGVSIAAGNAAIVAGTNTTAGFSGDGGPATSAKLRSPYGLAFDAQDNLYISDQQNFRIRKVDNTGTITTVAGTGAVFPAINCGGGGTFGGDGGVATSANLSCPLGVSTDAAGNIYINDLYNGRIRVVNTQSSTQTLLGVSVAAGTIQTVTADARFALADWFGKVNAAGEFCMTTPNGFGNLWKIMTDGTIVSIAGTGTYGTPTGDGGLATSARIGEPFDMVFVPAPPIPPTPTASGLLFQLSSSQLSDQQGTGSTVSSGTAINSTYTTYGFVNAAKSTQNPLLGFHRKRFSETQMYIKGSGQATMKAFPNYILKQDGVTFNPYVYTAPPIVLQTDPIDDIVRPLNISGNRVFVMYSTNAVGATFSLSKTILCGNIDSFSTVNPNA